MDGRPASSTSEAVEAESDLTESVNARCSSTEVEIRYVNVGSLVPGMTSGKSLRPAGAAETRVTVLKGG